METATFKQRLRHEGFIEGEVKALPPGQTVDEHDHPFDVCALVLEGEIALTVDNTETVYRPGQVFTMEAGCAHVEKIGAGGVRYLPGRRPPARES